MKSARKLIVAVGLFGLVLSGCMETNFGIVRPFGAKQPVTAERFDNPGSDGAAVQATAAKESKDNAGPVVSGGDAESSDPKVIALTKRIESLSARTGKEKAASKELPADDAVRQTAPAQSIARQDGARTDGERRNNDLAPRSAAPTLVRSDVSTTSNIGVGVNTPVGIAQPAAVPAPPQSEVTASPTPRPVPIVQPTAIVSDPTAPAASAANVSVEIVDVRPVVTPITSGGGNVAASANRPAEGDRNARATDLKGLITQLEQSAQQQPPHAEDTIRLRLLYLAAGLDDKAVAPIKDMDPMQAELLTAIVKTVASSRQAIVQTPNSNSTPSALTATDELRRLLGQQSGVTIPRMALVTKVTSYGDYDAISPLRFKAGSEIHAYVYTEIANFRPEPVDNDRLRTLLGEKVQVFDAAGKTVWERHEKNIEDRVRTPRRDFFIPFPVHLPANLPPGDYVLKVTVEDRIGGTTDQQRLSFSIQ